MRFCQRRMDIVVAEGVFCVSERSLHLFEPLFESLDLPPQLPIFTFPFSFLLLESFKAFFQRFVGTFSIEMIVRECFSWSDIGAAERSVRTRSSNERTGLEEVRGVLSRRERSVAVATRSRDLCAISCMRLRRSSAVGSVHS